MGNKSGNEALELLQEGNKRFTSGKMAVKDIGDTRREELSSKGQKPFAIIITCSDSRVPPELIFDQALGDLFVIRTAGNVVDQIGVGSAEYAVEHLEVPLLVVMGLVYLTSTVVLEAVRPLTGELMTPTPIVSPAMKTSHAYTVRRVGKESIQ